MAVRKSEILKGVAAVVAPRAASTISHTMGWRESTADLICLLQHFLKDSLQAEVQCRHDLAYVFRLNPANPHKRDRLTLLWERGDLRRRIHEGVDAPKISRKPEVLDEDE